MTTDRIRSRLSIRILGILALAALAFLPSVPAQTTEELDRSKAGLPIGGL